MHGGLCQSGEKYLLMNVIISKELTHVLSYKV